MTYIQHLGFLLIGLLLLVRIQKTNAQGYTAVVVPYKQTETNLPSALVNKNTRQYVTIIQDLKNQADIVVFPENGLTSLVPVTDSKTHNLPFSVIVQPETNAKYNQYVLPNISLAAKSNEIYVVVNVLELDNGRGQEVFYSTDLVYGPDGNLVLKCRKKRLYKEMYYNKGDLSQDCTFKAQFKRTNVEVEFTLLFDTDLFEPFEKINVVHDAILTSSLPNELPFSFGISLQQGFAVRNKVNLLAAGYTDPDKGYGGSGVYLRDGRSKVVFSSKSFLDGEVPINQKQNEVVNVTVTAPNKTDRLENVPYRNLPASSGSNDCAFNMDPHVNDIQPYKWVSFNNVTNLLGQQNSVIICALIKPEENKDKPKILNNLSIVVKIQTDMIGQALPLSLGSNPMVPANFNFKEEKDGKTTTITMNLSESKDLSVFGVVVTLKSGASMYVSHIFLMSLLPLLSIMWSKLVI